MLVPVGSVDNRSGRDRRAARRRRSRNPENFPQASGFNDILTPAGSPAAPAFPVPQPPKHPSRRLICAPQTSRQRLPADTSSPMTPASGAPRSLLPTGVRSRRRPGSPPPCPFAQADHERADRWTTARSRRSASGRTPSPTNLLAPAAWAGYSPWAVSPACPGPSPARPGTLPRPAAAT